jgi:hypothetical protein
MSHLIKVHALAAMVLRCYALVLLKRSAPSTPEEQELFEICQRARLQSEADFGQAATHEQPAEDQAPEQMDEGSPHDVPSQQHKTGVAEEAPADGRAVKDMESK